MSSHKEKNGGRRWKLATGASALAAAAAAMGGAPALAQDGEDDAIVVTGTRIPQPNLYTTSPVTQVTADDITTQGVTRIEDLTNELPQVFAAQGSNISNGATGTAEVDLRGLGPERTLVLINGRRMGYGSISSSAADLNQIPGQIVERVEVLTGGASAVYGSDAVAGVVNFIMRDDFEGLRLDAQYGLYVHENDYDGPGDLRNVISGRAVTNPREFRLPEDSVTEGIGKELTAVFGASTEDGRGNVTAFGTYRHNDPVLQSQYDYSACTIGTSAAANAGPRFACGGSATSASGLFTDFTTFALTVDSGVGSSAVGSSAFRDFSNSTDQYNFGPLNYFQRPDERFSFGTFARYEINPHVEAYAEMLHNDYRSDAQIAPSGNFGNTSTISCTDNVLLSSSQWTDICTGDRVEDIVDDPDTRDDEVQDYIDGVIRRGGTQAQALAEIAATIGTQSCTSDDPANPTDRPAVADPADCPLSILRRNVEGGPRYESLHLQSYRMIGGIRGALGESWSYDLSASYSSVSFDSVYNNDFSVTRLTRAIDVIADPATGDPVCRSVVDGTDPNCVPYNIFSPGGVTEAAINYLSVPIVQTGRTTQQVVLGTVTGEFPWTLPAAASPIAGAFGFEYRRDSLDYMTDTTSQTGDGAGQGGPVLPITGAIDVSDAFGEVRVPLADGQTFAHQASLDLAYRRSSYSSGVETETYKFGFDWAPVEDIRFRFSQQRAVRAPNIIELFQPQAIGLFVLDYDPCDAEHRPSSAGPVPTSCIGTNPWQVTNAQSVSGGLDSPAGQYNGFFGGVADLQPEESDTTTYGVVFTPSFLPSLNVSIDYFQIEVANLIGTIGPDNTFFDCYTNNSAEACARIVRDPATGQLWLGAGNVEDLNRNIGGVETSGIDINANYGLSIGSHELSFNLVGTWLDELVTDTGVTGVVPYDCAGLFGSRCGLPNPEWRHRFRLGWETPWSLELNLTWRHIDEIVQVDSRNVPVVGLDRVWEAEDYFDIAGNYQMLENANFRFGINNILDNDPPLSGRAPSTNGNTYPQVYDSLGRWVFAGVTIDW